MKVLVTGADGLLGSNLVRELLENSHAVRVLVQPGSPSTSLDGLSIERTSGDLLEGKLAAPMDGCDAVFHCAAITDQWADPTLVWKVNLEGTQRILDACVAARVRKLVFVGSASSYQFGTLERPGDETSSFPAAYRGVAYMESKHRASEIVRQYARERKLDAVVVCPTFLLGPHDTRPSSGELVRQFIVRRMKFTSPGGRNFVHARDAARAMVAALDRGKRGESYILGGENRSYLDFFTLVARAAGIAPPRWVLPAPVILAAGAAGSLQERIFRKRALLNPDLARLSVAGAYYSPAKAVAELGMPRTSIERAIVDSIESLRQHGHL